MFLLNRQHTQQGSAQFLHLHSTMFLLNRRWSARTTNTMLNLHSTMFLLNLQSQTPSHYHSLFTFHYVSIKSSNNDIMYVKSTEFTFHYVSIKSTTAQTQKILDANLHSTMFLLNRRYRLG